MKEIGLITDISFLATAQEKFNFPLNSSIRISFWLPNSTTSTFCEIIFNNENIELDRNYRARINVIERDFLIGRLLESCEFNVGNYPVSIGMGKIIQIL